MDVDDSNEVEGIDLRTFGQPIGPPPRFLVNDNEHDNLKVQKRVQKHF